MPEKTEGARKVGVRAVRVFGEDRLGEIRRGVATRWGVPTPMAVGTRQADGRWLPSPGRGPSPSPVASFLTSEFEAAGRHSIGSVKAQCCGIPLI